MTFSRDPLAVRFDPQARVVLGLAIAQREKHDANRHLVEYVRVRVPNPPGTMVREDRPDRLSPTERAFTRACYYDRRIHQLGRKKPDARWSLRLDWDPVPLLPGAQRYVQVTVFSDTSGARHVRRNADESYVENPELRAQA